MARPVTVAPAVAVAAPAAPATAPVVVAVVRRVHGVTAAWSTWCAPCEAHCVVARPTCWCVSCCRPALGSFVARGTAGRGAVVRKRLVEDDFQGAAQAVSGQREASGRPMRSSAHLPPPSQDVEWASAVVTSRFVSLVFGQANKLLNQCLKLLVFPSLLRKLDRQSIQVSPPRTCTS